MYSLPSDEDDNNSFTMGTNANGATLVADFAGIDATKQIYEVSLLVDVGFGDDVADLQVSAEEPTTTQVSSSHPSGSMYGQGVTFTATVAPNTPSDDTPTGMVQFQIDGNDIAAPVSVDSGSASLTIPDLSIGTHTVTAVYSGDNNFFRGSGRLSGGQIVTGPTVAEISGTVFQVINIDGVQDDGDPGITGLTVYLDLNGSGVLEPDDPSDVTNSNGYFQVSVPSVGTYTLREDLYGGVLLDSPASGGYQETVTSGANVTGQDFADVPTSIALPLTLPLTSPFPKQGNPNADFVEALYRAVLARNADPGGLAYWTGLLESGQLSRQGVGQGIRNSAEHFQAEVTDFYFTILSRAPDPGGMQLWVQALENGVPEEQMAADFLDSQEYLSKGDKYFVDHMYEALLGRAYDPSGEANWLDSLGDDASGNPTHVATATYARVIEAFLYSPESLNRLVEGYYQIFLQRLADPAGLSHWVADLQQGDSFLTIAEAFLTSGEFYNDAAAEG
jgi:hypothetical protein